MFQRLRLRVSPGVQRQRLILVSGLLVSAILAWLLGRANFVDLTEAQHTPLLATPLGDYRDVLWLSEHQVIFLFAHPLDRHPTATIDPIMDYIPSDYTAIAYTLDTPQWSALPLPTSSTCPSDGWPEALGRLPYDTAGFVYYCDTASGTWTSQLYAWDRPLTSARLIHRYPSLFRAGRYAMAPDAKQWVQEQYHQTAGEILHRVGSDGRMAHLVPHDQRLRAPAWASDGQTIAFAQEAPPLGSHLMTALGLGRTQQTMPWNLVLLDTARQQLHVALSGIHELRNIRWSPQGERIGFSGVYKGTPGIWIFTPATRDLTRVWPDCNAYDWSPDGRRLLVLHAREEYALTFPVMIDVSQTRPEGNRSAVHADNDYYP